MFKNKNVQTGLIIFLVIAILGGGYFFVAGKSKTKKEPVATQTQDVITSLTAEALGLSMEMSPDNKKVRIIIDNAKDIKIIEYQITYEADATAQELSEGGEDRVARGITGEAKVKSGSFESEWLDLGSCSKNVCKYDTGVTSLELTLKITKKDGKLYEASDTLEL